MTIPKFKIAFEDGGEKFADYLWAESHDQACELFWASFGVDDLGNVPEIAKEVRVKSVTQMKRVA